MFAVIQIGVFLIFSAILSAILLILSYICVQKNPCESKISAYECGFAAIKHPTTPFTIKFFIVGVIFLIFDLEIIYLIPWSLCSGSITLGSQLIIWLFFIFIIVGLIYEWISGGLEWI